MAADRKLVRVCLCVRVCAHVKLSRSLRALFNKQGPNAWKLAIAFIGIFITRLTFILKYWAVSLLLLLVLLPFPFLSCPFLLGDFDFWLLSANNRHHHSHHKHFYEENTLINENEYPHNLQYIQICCFFFCSACFRSTIVPGDWRPRLARARWKRTIAARFNVTLLLLSCSGLFVGRCILRFFSSPGILCVFVCARVYACVSHIGCLWHSPFRFVFGTLFLYVRWVFFLPVFLGLAQTIHNCDHNFCLAFSACEHNTCETLCWIFFVYCVVFGVLLACYFLCSRLFFWTRARAHACVCVFVRCSLVFIYFSSHI